MVEMAVAQSDAGGIARAPAHLACGGAGGEGLELWGLQPGGLGGCRTQERNWEWNWGGVHSGFAPEVAGAGGGRRGLSSEGPVPWYPTFLLSDWPRQKLGRTPC